MPEGLRPAPIGKLQTARPGAVIAIAALNNEHCALGLSAETA
jgi:hypothetical protein